MCQSVTASWVYWGQVGRREQAGSGPEEGGGREAEACSRTIFPGPCQREQGAWLAGSKCACWGQPPILGSLGFPEATVSGRGTDWRVVREWGLGVMAVSTGDGVGPRDRPKAGWTGTGPRPGGQELMIGFVCGVLRGTRPGLQGSGGHKAGRVCWEPWGAESHGPQRRAKARPDWVSACVQGQASPWGVGMQSEELVLFRGGDEESL